MILCLVILYTLFLKVSLAPLETGNGTAIEDLPQETQHAVCKVFTKEIEATAKATITRQLRGVCSNRDFHEKFHLLIQTIQEEFSQIRDSLGLKTTIKLKSLDVLETRTTTDFPVYDYPDSLDFNKSKNQWQEEVLDFNDTVVESSEGDLYFYFWKLPEIDNVLKKRDVYISSPIFSILGHALHLHFYSNYQNEYIGVLLKPDSPSFLKKHKISFLAQNTSFNEISSQILYGTKRDEIMFKVQPNMIHDFINNNSLLIKVKIYLDF